MSGPQRLWRMLRQTTEYYDFGLLIIIIILTGFGLIMLYSATAYRAQVIEGNDMTYFGKQGMISVICLVYAIVLSQLDYHLLDKVAVLLYGASLVLMWLVTTPLGVESHNATRWISLGPVSFQPSEVAKLAVIVFNASFITRMGGLIRTWKGSISILGFGFVQFLACLFLTDNLSTAIIIFTISAVTLFVAHPKTKPFLLILAGLAACVGIFVAIISHSATLSSDFRLRRIMVWLQLDKYADSWGYQTMQGLYAIGSGGLLGKGLGNSIQKLSAIPEAQNDMIFTIICEELGLLGASIVLLLFAYMLYRLMFIAQNAADLYGSLLVIGIFIHIAIQVILNIGVVVNLIPNTGVTLPFISYGGTSIVFLMTEMGIALSVSRSIRLKSQGTLL
ncbi:MAG: FtsW/RodA/SpoVE family cell cycle protein [Blautia sp.]|nr:FtsW/RodA/SpoVE family cell cycle protein [Blautia sp.]